MIKKCKGCGVEIEAVGCRLYCENCGGLHRNKMWSKIHPNYAKEYYLAHKDKYKLYRNHEIKSTTKCHNTDPEVCLKCKKAACNV